MIRLGLYLFCMVLLGGCGIKRQKHVVTDERKKMEFIHGDSLWLARLCREGMKREITFSHICRNPSDSVRNEALETITQIHLKEETSQENVTELNRQGKREYRIKTEEKSEEKVITGKKIRPMVYGSLLVLVGLLIPVYVLFRRKKDVNKGQN